VTDAVSEYVKGNFTAILEESQVSSGTEYDLMEL
jgi:hypothetical protein